MNLLLEVIAAGLLAALVWLAALTVRLSRAVRTYRELTGGVKPGNLEQIMSMHVSRINQHDRRLTEVDEALRNLTSVLASAIQRVGLIRFNPFDETGGDQSFAIALLDQQGHGLVLTSLHNRAETRVYAKPVQAGQSRYTLSDEEQQAVSQALDHSATK
ncbi:MAG: DUF4446 family protein [Chloroflexota bacterium]